MERFIVTYIPKTAVLAIETKHKEEIKAGASVWDFAQPESLEGHYTKPDESAALAYAKTLQPLDEYGEVHVEHDVWVGDKRDGYWETERSGYINEGDDAFTWNCL